MGESLLYVEGPLTGSPAATRILGSGLALGNRVRVALCDGYPGRSCGGIELAALPPGRLSEDNLARPHRFM